MDGDTLGHPALPGTLRRGLSRCARPGVACLVLAWAGCADAQLYRWVDEKGGVHYSDTLPPQYSGAGHQELNRKGRVIRSVEGAARDAGEQRRRDEEARRRQAEEQGARERQRQDNALLATFGSEAEIDRARDRVLEQERLLLEGLELMRRQSQSADEASHLDEMIRLRKRIIADIQARYEADKARYRALRGKPRDTP